MKVSKEFAGNYLKAADIPQPVIYTMATDGKETMPDKSIKDVLRFQGEKRGLVLNKTNATAIAELYGDDSVGWPGKLIELYALRAHEPVSEYLRNAAKERGATGNVGVGGPAEAAQ